MGESLHEFDLIVQNDVVFFLRKKEGRMLKQFGWEVIAAGKETPTYLDLAVFRAKFKKSRADVFLFPFAVLAMGSFLCLRFVICVIGALRRNV